MPETTSPEYAAAEREAYRGVRRACDAGLGSAALRTEVRRRITRLIPAEATYFSTVDPRTGHLTRLSGEGAPVEIERQYVEYVYPRADSAPTVDLARSDRRVTTESSGEMAALMREAGLRRELRSVFALGGEPLGLWLALRERSSRSFGEHDVAFLYRIAPHVARALRRAALVDAARVATIEEDAPETMDRAPGVVVIDDRWHVVQWTPSAEAHLADLADASTATLAPTSAIVDFLTRQRRSGRTSGVGLLSVPGRSGRWYTLRAAVAEPDEFGRSSTVVIVTPARRKHPVDA
jgi:hypothetical protein